MGSEKAARGMRGEEGSEIEDIGNSESPLLHRNITMQTNSSLQKGSII